MLVTCSICSSQFMTEFVGTKSMKSHEMAEHEAMHKSKGEIVEWIV